jgi:cytochrome b561
MTDVDALSETDEETSIGWLRAIATGLAILVITTAAAVFGANAILTKSLALTRTAREWLASALFFVVLIVVAAALRWLQHKRLI